MEKEIGSMMERIMDTDSIGYAYLYPIGGGARKEYVVATTPENLANFIGSHFYDAEKMVLTDILDRLIVDTCGGFLNDCPNQKLCGEIRKHLAPVQMGEKEAGKVLAVARAQAEKYWAMEDAAATMAEYHMEL